LQDYVRAVDALTISEEKQLRHVVEARSKIIEANLEEKDREIAGLKQKYDADIALLKEGMREMQQLLKNPEKLAEISRAANPEFGQ
jgi:hypothetical protein